MALESTQHKREDGGQTEQLLQMVSFSLGEELFGVDILKVQEINRLMEITKMPKVPDFVEGVINLRGRVIPIVDLRKRFHLPPVEHNRETRIIVVDISGMMMGMIVDSVSEVLRLPASTIEPAPDITTSIESQFIRGVAKLEKRLLIFLDLNKVFLDKEKAELDKLNSDS